MMKPTSNISAYFIHIHPHSYFDSSVFSFCHQGPIIYQFIKIQAGVEQLLLIAEQSVSSTSDLRSPERPFYSLTGTKRPMWRLLICANDTVFFIIHVRYFLLCFMPHKVISSHEAKVRNVLWWKTGTQQSFCSFDSESQSRAYLPVVFQSFVASGSVWKKNNTVDTAISKLDNHQYNMSWSSGDTSALLTIHAYLTLLPGPSWNYCRKWCKRRPGEAKTLYEGSLMRVWLTMDQNETRNNGTQLTDNIHSLHQMLVWEKQKKRLGVWLFGSLSC